MVAYSSTMSVLDVETNNVVDPVEEIRLRTWARTNYVPREERDENWHSIILDEMERKDHEAGL